MQLKRKCGKRRGPKIFVLFFTFQQAIEKGMNTVGIPPLHLSTKSPPYPDELGANICIRTVRRFLEKGHSLPQLIVISVSDSNLFK